MTPARRRLAIAVEPRLFSDALSRVLSREDRDVVVLDGDEAEGHFDIALVGTEETELEASVVIRLPEAPALGTARVGGRSVPLDDLGSLVALVQRCADALDMPPSTGLDR